MNVDSRLQAKTHGTEIKDKKQTTVVKKPSFAIFCFFSKIGPD